MNKIIGKNIGKARQTKKCNASQFMLAELLGYKSSVPISLIEAGKRKISVEKLYKISIALDKPMEWFCTEGNDIECGVCEDTNKITTWGKQTKCVFCEDKSLTNK